MKKRIGIFILAFLIDSTIQSDLANSNEKTDQDNEGSFVASRNLAADSATVTNTQENPISQDDMATLIDIIKKDMSGRTVKNDAEEVARQTELTIRLTHAKELMGRHYRKSIVSKTEGISDLRSFVFTQSKISLRNKWKHLAQGIAQAVISESKKYDFDPIFLMAVIGHESSFNPVMKGQFGEIGLMQIKPSTARWIANKFGLYYSHPSDLNNPMVNIQLGAAFLAQLREQFDYHSRLYLSAYNMGASNVNRALSNKIWPKDYVTKVMQHYVRFYAELKKPAKMGKISTTLANNDL